MQNILTCPICGKEFKPNYSWQRYCCKACGRQASYAMNQQRYDALKAVAEELQDKRSKTQQLIEDDYARGMSEEAIAEKYDVTVGVVLDTCQTLWELNQIRKNWDSKNNLYGESILQMLDAEEKVTAIAEKFSVQPINIRKVAKEKNYKIKLSNYYCSKQ